MALLALSGISVLFIALLAAGLCLGGTSSAVAPTRTARAPIGMPVASENKQYANIPLLVTGVHPVMSSAACWPGVWVGPAPVVHAHPAASPAPALMQRRHPSTVAARVISHRVLR